MFTLPPINSPQVGRIRRTSARGPDKGHVVGKRFIIGKFQSEDFFV